MFKRKCHGSAKIDAWVHVMTLGLITVACIGIMPRHGKMTLAYVCGVSKLDTR
jgi:hypothetical protein